MEAPPSLLSPNSFLLLEVLPYKQEWLLKLCYLFNFSSSGPTVWPVVPLKPCLNNSNGLSPHYILTCSYF